jgi:hypothetical protein
MSRGARAFHLFKPYFSIHFIKVRLLLLGVIQGVLEGLVDVHGSFRQVLQFLFCFLNFQLCPLHDLSFSALENCFWISFLVSQPSSFFVHVFFSVFVVVVTPYFFYFITTPFSFINASCRPSALIFPSSVHSSTSVSVSPLVVK